MSTGIGETLRAAREEQGRTLQEVALSLRVRSERLRAIEEERFGVFSGDVYAKGFIKNYAMELGIDPQPLLDTYRREVSHDDAHATVLVTEVAARPKERRAPPRWLGWVAAAVVVVAGLALLGNLGGRAPDVASPDDATPPPVAPADNDREEPEEPAEREETEPQEEPEPEPEPEGIELLLALEETSWLRVTVDGQVIFEQTVAAGETIPFQGEEEIEVRYGNPGGVRAQLNGEELGPQGPRGQPVNVRYTQDGAEEV